jgi:hypothetical protein
MINESYTTRLDLEHVVQRDEDTVAEIIHIKHAHQAYYQKFPPSPAVVVFVTNNAL